MSEGTSRSSQLIATVLAEHTLSERYFLGYATSRFLLPALDEIIVEPFAEPRDEYVYFRNHNLRAWVDGGTKHIEVPSILLARQVEKVYRWLGRSDQVDIVVENEVEARGGSIYEATERMMGAAVDSFYRELEPAGHVVLCRPEEVLVELLRDHLDDAEAFLDDYIAGSSKYLRRIDESTLDWDGAYEPYCETHPKFQGMDRMLDAIREQAGVDVTAATAKGGVLRGYRVDVDSRTLTLLSRGWGRDMTYAITAHLLEFTTPESVLFTGGCGAVDPDLELNDFVVPDVVDAPDEPAIPVDNVYLQDEWVRDSIARRVARGTAYNVDSVVDETIEYVTRLRDVGNRCVSMENYGVAKALEPTDVPLGILLFVMDCPLHGLDLGQTNYDPEKRGDLTFFGNALASRLTIGWHDLLDSTTAVLQGEPRSAGRRSR